MNISDGSYGEDELHAKRQAAMTTPNHQPPPPGMAILTDYTMRLPEGSVYSPDGENWYKSGNIGGLPFLQHIYAVPITPSVPATGDTPAKIAPGYNPDKLTDNQVGEAFRLLTLEEPEKLGDEWWNSGKWVVNKHIGDAPRSRNGYTIRRREGNETTTNEKGGEPCATNAKQITEPCVKTPTVQSTESQSACVASNAALDVQPVELRPIPNAYYECDGDCRSERCVVASDLAWFPKVKLWLCCECSEDDETFGDPEISLDKYLKSRMSPTPAPVRSQSRGQVKAFLEAAITEQIAQAEHWTEHYRSDPAGTADRAYWNGKRTAFQEALNLIQSTL